MKQLRALAVAAERAARATERLAKASAVRVSVDVSDARLSAYIETRAKPSISPE
jgi:hypothetical protein